MALSFYSPPFDSSTTGNIEGSCMQAGRENHVEWYGMSHEVVAQIDASGRPRNGIEHRPFTATKRVDRSSPLLQDTLTRRGKITQIEFRFYQPSATGEETHYFTVTLESARIVGIHMEQLNNRYPENMPHQLREHVSFSYDKVIWEEVLAGTMAFDSWQRERRGG